MKKIILALAVMIGVVLFLHGYSLAQQTGNNDTGVPDASQPPASVNEPEKAVDNVVIDSRHVLTGPVEIYPKEKDSQELEIPEGSEILETPETPQDSEETGTPEAQDTYKASSDTNN